MYDQGKGVIQDYEEAFKLYYLSAEQGFANAQYNLGSMYAKGEGVAKVVDTESLIILLVIPQNNFCEQQLRDLKTVFDAKLVRSVILSKSGQEAVGEMRTRLMPDGILVDWDKRFLPNKKFEKVRSGKMRYAFTQLISWRVFVMRVQCYNLEQKLEYIFPLDT